MNKFIIGPFIVAAILSLGDQWGSIIFAVSVWAGVWWEIIRRDAAINTKNK